MGTVRLGDYELLIRLASGGAANVFLVRDLKHENRLLALKILLPSLAQNEDFLNMFFTEAKIASDLSHPNIVTIAGFGQVKGIHCLAMEFVFGASLSQVLRASARAKKPLTVGVLLRLTATVCDALHYAHELKDETGEPMGLVHRDVTPQNILIGFNGVPKLVDFGIAKATNRGWETQAGIVKGKFSYMSPEQALGKNVDRRSDIFGAGIVLWEALTGRDLFRGSTPMEVLTAIREQKIEPPSRVVPGLTPIVDPIVMKALRRRPSQRYATAAEMRDEIEALIGRAGVKIDTETISGEFAEIYGDEIGRRALALKQAILGSNDLENLAEALGGSVLNPKQQLPEMQSGLSDSDPHGLFTAAPSADSDKVAASIPARSVISFDGPSEALEEEDDFEIIDDEGAASNEGREDAEAPPVPENRPVTGWDESTSTSIPEDELLSMISEEDATIGFLPPEFAERFGRALQAALEEDREFEEERTLGVPGTAVSRLRALSRDETGGGASPSPLRPLNAELSDSGPRAPRPVPRAPSVLMEEARLRDRFEPRAPSWDMDAKSGGSAGAGGGEEVPALSRPPLAPPPPPPRQASSVPAEAPAPQNGDSSVQDVAAVDFVPDLGRDGSAYTDRAPAPAARSFGTYSFTQGTNKAWGETEEALEEPLLPSAMPPESGPGVGPAADATAPLASARKRPAPDDSESDWAAPDGSPEDLMANATVVDPEPASSLPETPVARAEDSAVVDERKPPVQLSMTMLLILAIILLIAGAALGALLGPQI